MKIQSILPVFLFAAAAFSQTLPKSSPPPQRPASENGGASGTVSADSRGFSIDSGTFERTSDKIFDFNSDSLNLEDGTLNWKGKTFQIGNSRVVRARFERYLALDFSGENFQNYQKILSEISSILAANNADISSDAIKTAWSKLYDAAEYDIDGGASITVANTVYQTWRMRGEFKNFKVSEVEAERARRASERALVSYEKNFIKSKEQLAKEQQGVNPKRLKIVTKEKSAAEAKSYADQLLKDTQKLASTVVAKEAIGAQSVLQFQSQTLTFLLSRRFQHAGISASFYRHLYKARAQAFEVGKEQFSNFFPLSNFAPTNDILESLSTEARNDVREGMEAVENLYDSGQSYSALNRLMETFVLGENEPCVRSFNFEKKKVLHELYRDLSALKDFGDNRDFEAIENLVEKIRKVSSDFPYREIVSKVKIGKQASNLKVMAAKAAAISGDMELAAKNLKEAAEIWPLNPEIDAFNTEAVKQAVGAAKYSERFDSLYERQNYREIMESATEMAIALKNDPARLANLKQVVSKISQIDIFIAQAEELDIQGNSYIAWEMLERAKKIDPADPMLARASAKLAPKVSDYVMYLDRARALEKSNNHSAALNLYLKARRVFPTSASCREGIERTSKALIESLKAETGEK